MKRIPFTDLHFRARIYRKIFPQRDQLRRNNDKDKQSAGADESRPRLKRYLTTLMQLCDRLPSSPGKTRMFPIIFSLSSFVVALYVVSRVLRKHYLLASQGSLAVLGKLDVTRWNCALNCAALQIFGERFDPPAVRSVKQDAEVKTSTTYIFYAFDQVSETRRKNFQMFIQWKKSLSKSSKDLFRGFILFLQLSLRLSLINWSFIDSSIYLFIREYIHFPFLFERLNFFRKFFFSNV